MVINGYETSCKEDPKIIDNCISANKQYCITQCILSKSDLISKDIDKAQKIVDQVKDEEYKKLLNQKEFSDLKDLPLNEDEYREIIRSRLLVKEKWNEPRINNEFVKKVFENENNIKLNG